MPFKSYSGGGGGYLQAAKRYNVKGQHINIFIG